MKHLKIYDKEQILSIVNNRAGEIKFGEKVKTLKDSTNLEEDLLNSNAKYVLFGIEESIGVKANFGNTGTETAWKACLKCLLNTQNNSYNKGKKILILGSLNFNDLTNEANKLNTAIKEELEKLHKIVSKIDIEVSNLVFKIIKSGKKPIIIGGGHNNSYGNIKGVSLALNKPINTINLDAHTDFRPLTGRHSGNGFSYAYKEGFLNKYFIFGIHENYTSKQIFKELNSLNKDINYNTFEAINIRKETSLEYEMKYAYNFIKSREFGVEIDLDAIEGIESSAMTPSGFSTNEARQFVSYFSKSKKAIYLHLCEAIAILDDNKNQTGKLLSYLITDFIR